MLRQRERRRVRRAIALALLLAGAESGVPALARAGERGADGRFDRRDSSHFALYQDVDLDRRSGRNGTVRFERTVLEVLERAYAGLEQRLGLRPRRRIAVILYDPRVFDRQFAGLFPFPSAGFYSGTIRVRAATRTTPALRRVLHHELVHAAWDAAAPSLVLPGWLNEGLAEWFAARALGQRTLAPGQWEALSAAARGDGLVSLAALSAPSFVRLAPGEATLAYLQSFAMIDALVREHGEEALRRFCQRLLRRHQLERAFAETFRESVPTFDAALRARVSAAP